MDNFEIDKTMETLTIAVDTREQNTALSRLRCKSFGYPYTRQKLDFGDYSAFVTVGNEIISLANKVAIERKYDLSELAMCFCGERKRFEAEFERAKASGARLYILCENGSWEKAYAGEYRSLMTPKALVASMTAWLARYNCQILFCEASTSGKLIGEILKREMKEYLKGL